VLADVRLTLAHMATTEGDLDAARESLAAGLEMALAVGRTPLQLRGLIMFADLLHAQGERELARRVLVLADSHPATAPPERREIGTRLAALGGAPAGAPLGLAIEELVHRIIAVAGHGHRPLIAALR
jgi:hypothetical protein